MQCSKVGHIKTEISLWLRNWISSWPLNKVCYPCQELQLLLRVHCHVNTLDYSSSLVKVVLWKLKLWVNYDLEANLAHVMNTNIVPFSILDVSKVILWPRNHILHWSHKITSIYMYISTSHVIICKNKMKFHMPMLMNAWMMLVLMKCRCQMQCLTLGCYTHHP